MKDCELAKLRKQKIGFVLQEFGLIEEETVLNNILVPTLFSKQKKIEEKRIEEICEEKYVFFKYQHLIRDLDATKKLQLRIKEKYKELSK